MGISRADYELMLQRSRERRQREIAKGHPSTEGCTREVEELHMPIIKFCNSQTPRWKFIWSRTDQQATIAKGCQDFTIFAPGRRLFLFECKSRTGKKSPDQLAWSHEMELLGWEVRVIRSYGEFLAAVLVEDQSPRASQPAETPATSTGGDGAGCMPPKTEG